MIVSSFRHDVVQQCAAELDIECGLLFASRPLDLGSVIAACADRPRIRSVVWDYNIIDEGMLDAVNAAGWNNFVYGAVTVEEHAHCGALGLAGVITDHPQRAGCSR